MQDYWKENNWRDVYSIQPQFNQALENIGEYFVYLKTNSDYYCTNCFDPVTLDPDQNCTECYGTGFKTTPYFTKGIFVDGESPLEGSTLTQEGLLARNITSILFPVKLDPSLRDIILRVDWNISNYEFKNSNYTVPSRLTHVFQVSYVGRVFLSKLQYFTVQITEINEKFNFLNTNLPRFTNLDII